MLRGMCKSRNHAATTLLPCLLVLVAAMQATAQSQNRSERYTDAYKRYLNAKAPIPQDDIRHFVYFARDREAIHGHAFLNHPGFHGAQIMYPWSRLEPQRGVYDFSTIREDVKHLESAGKKLFIQVQDATFSPKYRGVPAYLTTAEFDGGVIRQRDDKGVVVGWVAKRWNTNVRNRFGLLLEALGKEFDGKIEGINLQETAIEVNRAADPTFSPSVYADSVRANMAALKTAFARSTTMQYANFMPGEWLPWDDKGYLRSIYRHGQEIGVGLGAPDLLIRRKGQLNHALAMMHESTFTVPLGIAVQDGNYVGATGADRPPGSDSANSGGQAKKDRRNLVPMLHAFAKDFLRVRYMFWSHQEPYFEQDVLPSFERGPRCGIRTSRTGSDIPQRSNEFVAR